MRGPEAEKNCVLYGCLKLSFGRVPNLKEVFKISSYRAWKVGRHQGRGVDLVGNACGIGCEEMLSAQWPWIKLNHGVL